MYQDSLQKRECSDKSKIPYAFTYTLASEGAFNKKESALAQSCQRRAAHDLLAGHFPLFIVVCHLDHEMILTDREEASRQQRRPSSK